MLYSKITYILQRYCQKTNRISISKEEHKKNIKLIQKWTGVYCPDYLNFFKESYFLKPQKYVPLRKKSQGKHLFIVGPKEKQTIYYSTFSSPFGECFLAYQNFLTSSKENSISLYKLSFIEKGLRSTLEEINSLQKSWPKAIIKKETNNSKELEKIFFQEKKVFSYSFIFPKATPLQLSVWKKLASLFYHPNAILSYSALAQEVNHHRAVRSIASAVAKNPIAYFIPCHRIVSKNKKEIKYRWGKTRKLSILFWEFCKQSIN